MLKQRHHRAGRLRIPDAVSPAPAGHPCVQNARGDAVHNGAQIGKVGGIERRKVVKVRRRVGVQPQCVPLEHLQCVKRTVRKARTAGNLRFPTAVVGKFRHLVRRVALPRQRLQHQRLVVHRNSPAAVPLYLRHAAEQLLRRIRRQPDRDGVIRNGKLLHDVQYQVGHAPRHLPAVPTDAADDQILVVLGIAGAGGRVALDPFTALDKEAGKYLPRLVLRQPPGGKVCLQVRLQQLVDAPQPRPVAAQPREGKAEPQRLHRLTEGARRREGNLPEQGVQIGACRFGGGKIAPVPDTERPQGCGGRA